MKRRERYEPERDRWGRPIIDGRTYTRASTLAKALDDQSALIDWSARVALQGMSRQPHLLALASTTPLDDRKTWQDIAKRAKEAGGATSGRDTGTSIHAATEAIEYGEDVSHLPADLRRDAEAALGALADCGVESVAAETFVLCDEVGAAGSFDRLLWSQASNLYAIGDIKTGSSPDPAYALRYSGLSWAIQLAIYAHGTPWPGGWDAIPADPPRLDIGVVLYVPRGSGVCHPITVDLAKGWRAAQLAAQVRTIRKESVAVWVSNSHPTM